MMQLRSSSLAQGHKTSSSRMMQSASRVRPTLRAMPVVKAFKVTLKSPDGKTQQMEVPQGKTILEAALDQNIDLPHSCHSGGCCVCTGKVVSGTVEFVDSVDISAIDEEQHKLGYALMCAATPKSDLVILTEQEQQMHCYMK